MSKLPYFPFYVSDFKGATDYLDLEDVGLYVRMLCLLWETPTCSFPNDFELIKKRLLIKNNDFDARLKIVLRDFFIIKRGKYIQKRLMQEYVKANDTFNKYSNAGKKGAKAKSLKSKKKGSSDEQAMNKPGLSDEQASKPISKPIIKNTKKNKSSLSEDWQPSSELIASIAEKEHTTQEWVKGQIEPFKNYWLGEGGTKVDWDRTFRNRCNNDYNNKPKSNGHANGQSTFWHHPLQNYKLYGEWHVETCGEHKPTTNGKPDGPLNPKCKAPKELIKQILNVGDLL